jgi:hypothetical protein
MEESDREVKEVFGRRRCEFSEEERSSVPISLLWKKGETVI